MKIFPAIALFFVFANPAFGACVPNASPPGSIGCLPILSSSQSGDYITTWRVSAFPASASLTSVSSLFATPTIGSLTVTGNTTLSNATTSGTLGVGTNATVGGTLGVTGNTTLSNATTSGTLGVGTNATVGGTLGVTGNTTLSNATTSGTLGVGTNATVGGTLRVTGAATFGYDPATINVRNYGAIGNGTTDDTAAIQAAATACPAAGCTLYFPPGYTFGISAAINLKSNTKASLWGSTVLVLSGASNVFRNVDYAATTLTDSNITIEGGTLDYGSSGAGTGSHAISMSFVNHVQVRGTIFQLRGAGDATAFVGCNDTVVDGVTAFGFTNTAFDHWWGPTNARVVNSYASTVTTAQMVNFNPENTLENIPGLVANGFVLANNQLICTGATSCPVLVAPITSGTYVKNVTITGNIFKNVNVNARGATQGVTVAGNTFNGISSGSAVIGAYGAFGGVPDSISATGNTIINPLTDAGNYAVFEFGATNSSITGNTISGTAGACYAATYTGAYPTVIAGNNGWSNCTYGDTGSAWVTSAQPVKFGTVTTSAAITTPQLNLAGTGTASIVAGTGAPGSGTPGYGATGSIFIRTDGAIGTHIYVSTGSGAWTALAGV